MLYARVRGTSKWWWWWWQVHVTYRRPGSTLLLVVRVTHYYSEFLLLFLSLCRPDFVCLYILRGAYTLHTDTLQYSHNKSNKTPLTASIQGQPLVSRYTRISNSPSWILTQQETMEQTVVTITGQWHFSFLFFLILVFSLVFEVN